MTQLKDETISANSEKPAVYKVDEYQQFLDFYTLPAVERKRLGYKSLGEWSIRNGVHRNTITRWKARDDFKREVYEKRMEWGSDQIGEVLEGWKKACMKGSTPAIELWLAYFSGWNKNKLDTQHRESFNQDDMRSLVTILPPDRQKYFYQILAQLIIESEQVQRQ